MKGFVFFGLCTVPWGFGKVLKKTFPIPTVIATFLIIISGLAVPLRAADNIRDPGSVEQGSLLVKTARGEYQQLPLLDTQVAIKVSGMIARVKVKQFFQNQSEDYIEAVYIFPLPENSAVDHLSMLIGEQRVMGEIKEKSIAKKLYQQAKAMGKKTALLEQKRANIFSTHLANIAPDEVVEIMIEYQQYVEYKSGEFSLRFPTAITPRYHPGISEIRETFQTKGETAWVTNPSASLFIPAVADEVGAENSISIDIDLDAGLPIESIDSPYHNIVSRKISTGSYQISLQNYQISDRDFELRWRVTESDIPRVAMFLERSGEEEYMLLMVTPPESKNVELIARELTLVIDQSGSMEGESMEQAIFAVQQALKNLTSDDRFNIIAFNDKKRSLFTAPVEANQYNLNLAKRFVASLKATGGTEMLPALRAALAESATVGYVRQVVFITDGAVSNEGELFSVIHSQLGEARLFTIGIGSAPNGYFMRKAAQFGRGSFTTIGKSSEVVDKMRVLFQKLESPVMQNINLSWAMEVEQFPKLVPDLYRGEPLMLMVSSQHFFGEIAVSGEQGGSVWQAIITIDSASSAQTTLSTSAAGNTKDPSGIGVLWARAKIAELHDQQIVNPVNSGLKQEIIDLALQHHLVSRYTSLVAVDQTVERPGSANLTTKIVPNHLPAGSSGQTFGYPSTASGWKLQLLMGGMLLMLSVFLWLGLTPKKIPNTHD